MATNFDEALDFIANNGKDMVQIAPYKWVLQTGATIVGGRGVPAQCFNPPTDAKACLTLRRKYYTVKQVEAERAFNNLKAVLNGGVDDDGEGRFVWEVKKYGIQPEPTNDWVKALARLKEIAQEHRRMVKNLDTAIANLPEERAKVERERRQKEVNKEVADREAERKAALKAAVASITLEDEE